MRAVDPRELASARGHRRSKVTWAYLFAQRMSSVSSPPFGAFPMLPPSLSFQRGPMRGRKRTRQTPSRPRVRRVCQPSAPAKSEERAPYALARHRETARPPVVRVLWRERITQLLFFTSIKRTRLRLLLSLKRVPGRISTESSSVSKWRFTCEINRDWWVKLVREKIGWGKIGSGRVRWCDLREKP